MPWDEVHVESIGPTVDWVMLPHVVMALNCELYPVPSCCSGIRLIGTRDGVVGPLPDVARHVPDDAAVREGEGSDLSNARSRAATGGWTVGANTVLRVICWGDGCLGRIVIAMSFIEGA